MIRCPTRLALTTFIAIFLMGCSSAGVTAESPSLADEDAFNRTTSCVNGGLPVEIRYALLGKPTKLSGRNFDMQGVDNVARELDIRVAALLEAAMHRAWKLAAAKHEPWSTQFYTRLEIEFAGEIAERAPSSLQMEFCGDRDSVGSAAFAAIASYFSRSVTLEGGRQPEWLRALGPSAESKGTSIVMIAVALRLAKIEFDPMTLARASTE